MYRRIGHLKSTDAFIEHLREQGLDLPTDEATLTAGDGSPLAEPIEVGGFTVGNRWAIQPMEGWDGTADGRPSEHTVRRWKHFGESGAKLIWGGEAVAVQQDGRANPNQLYYRPENIEGLRDLRQTLIDAHTKRFGADAAEDLLIGLQLTHSGRFCRPNRKDTLEPRIAYHHPLLDARAGIDPGDDAPLLSDEEIERLIERYVEAARTAQQLGFQFVDVKHCHGYLGHEFLSAYDRPGPFGGDFEGRTRFLRKIVEGIRAACPGLMIGVRLSIFDFPPFEPDPEKTRGGKLGPGIPEEAPEAVYPGFGCDRNDPLSIDLTEPIQLLTMLRDALGVELVNLSAGSPYYNPHIQRPAFFPPSDGYQPPEDPLAGCVRQMQAVRDLKRAVPGLPMLGSAFSYLQEYLPHVAQAVVREGWMDFVGLGRMVLSYWDLPADVLEGHELKIKRVCRTFSDCTTGPRNGLISGCFPLDEYYKKMDEARQLKEAKRAQRERLKQAAASDTE